MSKAPPDAPAGQQITCRDYERGDGKRCVHYGTGGACALPTTPVCTEWLKVNPGGRGAPLMPAASAPSALGAELPAITPADIASFRALRVEVCFHSPTHGELWLVPAYTGNARREITPEHVLTVDHVLRRFPGARVAALLPPERPERLPSKRRS